MKFLDLAAGGMDVAGVAVGGWYVAAKYQDRVRRDADLELANDKPPSAVAPLSEPGLSRGSLSVGATGGEDAEAGAEELLAVRAGRFGGPFFGMAVRWWEWIWRRLAFLGWLRFPLLAPVGLALFVLCMGLCGLLLPFIIVGFLFDIGNDFRLRIIVLAFALGICLQIASALTG